MDLYEWFQYNCVHVPTKADRKIVRDVIATQYPNDLAYIEDHWGEEFAYINHGSLAKFSMSSTAGKGATHSVDDFLAIFCMVETADEAVNLDDLL